VRSGSLLTCDGMPCADVDHGSHVVPEIELDPGRIRILMVSEAAPAHVEDWFYSGPDALFAEVTVEAFCDNAIAGGAASRASFPLVLRTGFAVATTRSAG
jgi:hypothetical protein